MSELILFGSTLGMVFFMGFQSLAVNSGQYWLAVVNSFIIGMFNLLLYKTAPHVAGNLEVACYITGGPVGICLAMWVHRNVMPRIIALSVRRAAPPVVLRSGIKVWPNGKR